MNEPTQRPADHYREAERLVAAAEGSVTEQIQTSAAMLALAHAVLATVDPKRLRGRHQRPARYSEPLPSGGGGTYVDRFIRGEDEGGQR